jgi:integrase
MHRTIGRTSKQTFGITESNLEKMINATESDARALRDKSLLFLAYDSLCRRSELVSFRLSDIEYNISGLPFRIKLRRSKTDQEAIGTVIRLSPKAQEAVQAWIEITRIEDGYLFRGIKNNEDLSQGINPGQINRIYKRLAEKAGLPKIIIKNMSGHSFRVGGAQDLLASGASLPILMNRGGWTKPETVMRYIEYS